MFWKFRILEIFNFHPCSGEFGDCIWLHKKLTSKWFCRHHAFFSQVIKIMYKVKHSKMQSSHYSLEHTVKPVKNGYSQIYKTKVLTTNGSLMKVEVKSIAECAKGNILHYFWPSLSDNWSWKPIFGLLENGRFTQVLLYMATLIQTTCIMRQLKTWSLKKNMLHPGSLLIYIYYRENIN